MLKRFGYVPCLLSAMISVVYCSAQQDAAAPNTSPRPAVHLETLVVTGTYEPVSLEASERAVELIDLGQARELYGGWMDGLRFDPSVDLRQRAPGIQADLSIRGSSFGQTLVLVDGLRLNDAQSVHHNLDLPLPFESISRIEVLHGSGSTMYGSDAVGGVVNFLTEPALATEMRLKAGGGNYGSNQESGSISARYKSVSEQLSSTRDFSSGFMPDRDYRNLAVASVTYLPTRLGNTRILVGLSDRPFGANQFYGDYPSWESAPKGGSPAPLRR